MGMEYMQTCTVAEAHGKPIYCISFNHADLSHQDLLASVGANTATVYRCKPEGALEVLKCYIDAEESEKFYVCKWSYVAHTGAPLLLLAGFNAVMRVINYNTMTLMHTLWGHGNPINDIAVHPQHPALVVTASKDNSIRLWNLVSGQCVAVFAGEGGHDNEVLSLDWHPWDGAKLLSAAMDSTVKIWSLHGIWPKVEQSFTWRSEEQGRHFAALHVPHPVFSSIQVHGNYVDCVRWLGDHCLSKSVDNKVLRWRPDPLSLEQASSGARPTPAHKFMVLKEFHLRDARMWFVRFSLDASCSFMACGDALGVVYVWDLDAASNRTVAKLKTGESRTVVRQTALNADGSTLLACCEDGTIHRWDRRNV